MWGTSSPEVASPLEAQILSLLVLIWDSLEGPPQLRRPHGTSRATVPLRLFPCSEDLPTNLMVHQAEFLVWGTGKWTSAPCFLTFVCVT